MNKALKYTAAMLATGFLVACGSTTKLDRSIVPTPGAAPVIQMGEYEKVELDNGLRLIVVENHKRPVVSYQLTLVNDPVLEGDKAGYTSMAGSLMKTGTTSKTKAEIDESIDFIGANFSTFSGGFFASSLKKHSDVLMELVGDVVLNPTFPQEEVDKAIKQTLSGLEQGKNDPNSMASNIRGMINYGPNHPYGEVETPETVENITRADLVNYYDTYFAPNKAILVVVGDITPSEAKAQVEKALGAWSKKEVPSHTYTLPEVPAGNQVVFVPLSGAVQSQIGVTHTFEMKPGDKDAIALSVANTILGGGGFSGRLQQNIREDKAYTYGAYSSASPNSLVAAFTASASVRNEVTDSAVVEFLYEIDRMGSEMIPDSTLTFTKNMMSGKFAQSLERPQTIANFARNIERFNLPKDYYANYLAKLNAVTKEDVQAVSKKYISNNNYIAVVGNKTEIDKLAKFSANGKVAVVDQYGEEYKDLEAAPEGVTVDKVLMAYVDAIGGEEKWKGVKTLEQTGKFEMGPMALDLKMKVKGDKVAMEVKMGSDVMMSQKFNGKTGTMAQGPNVMPMGEDEIADVRMQSDFLSELHLGDYGITPELLGVDEIDGKKAYVVKYKKEDGSESTNYFGVDSGLLLKSEETQETPMGPMTEVTMYSGYKEFDGVLVPTELNTEVGPQKLVMRFETVKINSKISDKDFE